ncbi:MAG TPA: hypothetical protein VLA43_06800 [Longimicrobiales bacterium]|nr:hypothetical protein [Longimicrobiales bacterium]
MNRLLASALLILATLGAPTGLQAQEGWGGIIDFINRLSGPRMVGVAGSYFHPVSEHARFRISAAFLTRLGSDDVVEPDDAAVRMFSIKPALEIPLKDPLELSVGASLHRFFGDADEGFWHGSFPVHLQLRLPLSQARDGSGLHLRAGVGAEYFMEFDADDFAPVVVDWSTDGGEFELVAFLGFDWVLR